MQKMTPLRTGFVILFLFIFAGTAVAGQISLSFVPDEVDLSLENGIATFEGTDLAFSSKAGDPNIPWKRARILLPPNTSLSTVSARAVITGTMQVTTGCDVSPATPPATYVDGMVHVSWPAGAEIVDKRNILVYEKESFYPCEPEGTLDRISTGGIRRWKFVDINVPLFLFEPVNGELRKVTSCTLEVEYSDPLSLSSLSNDTSTFGADKVKKALNYDDMASQYDQGLESSSALPQDEETGTYAIITTDYIVSNSEALAEFEATRTAQGWNVLEVTESEWGGGTGDEASENIRSWLQENYAAENITCVLLIGNPAPVSGDVPMKMTYPRNNATFSTEYKDCPTDFYYAELDGDWDLDGDGLYGEWGVESGDTGPGGVNASIEVMVGRIPVYDNNISDLDSILNAIMDYQETPVNSGAFLSRKKMLVATAASNLADEDEGTPVTAGWPLGENLKEYVTAPEEDWEIFRIYEMVENIAGELPDPEVQETCSDSFSWYFSTYIDTVTRNWSEEIPGVAIWWTHGSSTEAWKLMDSDTSSLLPDYPRSVVFQVSCLNAYPEEPDNLTYSMLKNTAVAAVGATRVSWYYVGLEDFNSGYGDNASTGYRFMAHLVSGDRVGEALGNAIVVPDGAEVMHNILDFNLYGDPSLTLEDAGIECYSILEPEPQDGAIDVERDVTLSWIQETSPDITGWSINFGTDPDGLESSGTSLSGEELTNQGISFTGLEKETTYYWQVITHTDTLDYYGDVWSFTTRGTFVNTTPETDSIDPSEDLLLTWDSEVEGETTWVFFGTDEEAVSEYRPGALQGETTGTSYLIPSSQLEEGTTYYWMLYTEVEGQADTSPVYQLNTIQEDRDTTSSTTTSAGGGGGGCNIGATPWMLMMATPLLFILKK